MSHNSDEINIIKIMKEMKKFQERDDGVVTQIRTERIAVVVEEEKTPLLGLIRWITSAEKQGEIMED